MSVNFKGGHLYTITFGDRTLGSKGFLPIGEKVVIRSTTGIPETVTVDGIVSTLYSSREPSNLDRWLLNPDGALCQVTVKDSNGKLL